MATTSPARIDDDLYASAKLAGEVQSRSASQQVAHWARIGREIEASAAISLKEIAEVLAGSRPYDALTAKEQAVVRAEWAERMRERRASLDFVAEFGDSGRMWVELDDDGAIVQHGAEAPTESTPAKRHSTSSRTTKPTKKAASKKTPAKRTRPAATRTKNRPAG